MITLLRSLHVTLLIGLAICMFSGGPPCIASPVASLPMPICNSIRNALNNQESVDISGSTAGWLSVWEDYRGDNGADIFGTRISPSGQILDPYGIEISNIYGDQTTPAVSWNGQMYLVVWSDGRGALERIYAARVLANGAVLDPGGILLSNPTAGLQVYPRVASDGTGWFVVWQDSRSGANAVYGCKVAADGSLSTAMGIATRADNEEIPDVAWNGTYYLVAWCDYRNSSSTDTDIYGCRVAKNGVRLGPDILISCDSTGTSGATGAQDSERLCAFGTSWMVVWEDYRSGTTSRIYGTRVNSSGTVQDKNGIAIRTTGTSSLELPSVSYDGKNLLVGWRDHADRIAKGVRVTTSGTVLDSNTVSFSQSTAGSNGVAVSGSGGNFLVAWNTLSIADADVLGTLVSDGTSATSTTNTVVSTSPANQDDCSVVDNGTQYVAVWAQQVNGLWAILGARVSHAGVLLTPTAVTIATSSSGDLTQPSIAWNGTKYLVAWAGPMNADYTGMQIQGQFLDTNLNKTGSTLILCTVTGGQSYPCVASNGVNFLVAWEDYRNAVSPDYTGDIYGAAVSSTGTITPIASGITLASGDQLSPKVASDGSNYFVVWENWATGAPIAYGARVSSTGTVMDTAGIAMPKTSSYQASPNICFGSGNYFIAWSDYSKISGCRISSAGTIADKSGITIESGPTTMKSNPSVTWDGTNYDVAWEDYRSTVAGNAGLYCACVTTGGVRTSDPTAALVVDTYPQLEPKIILSGTSGIMFYTQNINYASVLAAVTLANQGLQTLSSVGQAKAAPAGTLVALSGKPVVGSFSGYFYIEDPSRATGIKVVSSTSPSVGQSVDVTGVLGVVDGERQITASTVTNIVTTAHAVQPLCIRGDCVGGAPFNAYTPGITGAMGLNNIGLLVTTYGPVSAVGTGCFYIKCKPATIMVLTSSTIPAVGKLVSVTGISSCQLSGGAISSVIRTRQSSDVRILH